MITHKPSIALCIILSMAALPGCKHQAPAAANDLPKEAQTPAADPTRSGPATTPASDVREIIVSHEAPKTWKFDPTPRQMRDMTFFIGEGEKAATVIVSRMPEITYTNNPLSNVNRWRGQVSMVPVTDIAEQKMGKVRIGAGEGTMLDLAGMGNRHMIVAMLQRNGIIWYFKLVGHHEIVDAEKKGMESFLASIKFGEGKPPSSDELPTSMNTPATTIPSGHPSAGTTIPEGHAPMGGGSTTAPANRSSLAEYKAPATWKQDPQRRPMRELTYIIGDPAKDTLVIVSRLPAESYTVNPLANINRWRDQVGLGLIQNMSDQPSRKITIDGEESSLYDLTGPRGGRQILALVMRGNDIWYFKIIGISDLIEPEKANFEAFLASIKFTPNK